MARRSSPQEGLRSPREDYRTPLVPMPQPPPLFAPNVANVQQQPVPSLLPMNSSFVIPPPQPNPHMHAAHSQPSHQAPQQSPGSSPVPSVRTQLDATRARHTIPNLIPSFQTVPELPDVTSMRSTPPMRTKVPIVPLPAHHLSSTSRSASPAGSPPPESVAFLDGVPESTLYLETERPEHQKVMKTYRVKPCPAGSSCPNPQTCWEFHNRDQQRREVKMLGDGTFSYGKNKCPLQLSQCSDTCPNSHEPSEIPYHPLTYKTHLCRKADHQDPSGPMYDTCSYAHSPDELRDPRQLRVKGMHHIVLEKSLRNTDAIDRDKFRTEPCRASNCNPTTCVNFHKETERRRVPSRYIYSAVPCSQVKADAQAPWGSPSLCKDGDACKQAHTQEEVMYHSSRYKSRPCSNFRRYGICKWMAHCAFYHGDDDPLRPENQGKILPQQKSTTTSWWIGDVEPVTTSILSPFTVDQIPGIADLTRGVVDYPRLLAFGLPDWYEMTKETDPKLADSIARAMGVIQ